MKEHIHNEALEGPLPPGYPVEGREAKVRNIYTLGEKVCSIASDRLSAFDIVSPTPLSGKGEILNDIARQELEVAEAAGIPTWLEYVPEDNPRASVGTRADVLPAEMIFRNYMTGSMWREYRDTGDFAGLDLPSGLKEWQDFTDNPLFTPSTKGKEDVNFTPSDAESMAGIDPVRFKEMEELGRELFRLGTARAAERGLVLVDTKYEMGVTAVGKLVVIDEVHTPDSSRFVMADNFEEAMREGRKPRSLSKEFLREIILDRAGGDVNRARQLMTEPLPDDIVEEILSRYRQLHQVFTGQATSE
jgi:phosphoribosylaminoimidazole-succinocarboxamide synthase